MFPASFAYHRPQTIDEAIALLGSLGDDTKLMAGGHSLIPSMKLRLLEPKHLIDLGGIAALKGVRISGEELIVGAATTHYQVESSKEAKAALPLLCEVAGLIADPQVRNRGTMGGSLANSDPAADWPATAVALDAAFVCRSSSGERVVPASEWFQGLFTTALEEGEVLCELRYKRLPPRTAATYLKLPHPASRFAVVGVSAAITTDEAGNCIEARIGITGVNTHAVRASGVEAEIRGKQFTPALIAEASLRADEDMDVSGDMHFSEEDKRELCRAYVERALLRVLERTKAGAFQGI
ncbi:MAG: xanthine dehydrogenase family protein subunit M [Xanthobacteraceae bacterium]|nr:xanthine dehydrogenase family protein subunit M [Xanthobacteraceae bacterium]QYK45163.1 MAG: xanthine dehydrogenase family protein subunit M [Xanthobacteraceae bacterium]